MARGGVCVSTARKKKSPEHQEKATIMMIIIINEQTANNLQVSARIVDGCELIN